MSAEKPIEKSFTEKALAALEQSLLKQLSSGEAFRIDYHSRPVIGAADLQSLYQQVDMRRVFKLALEKLEGRMADLLLNGMATELATDVKKVLSNQTLREDIRSYMREKIKEVVEKVTE